MTGLRFMVAGLLSLALTACPYEDPPVPDFGPGADTCGRDSYGEEALLRCPNQELQLPAQDDGGPSPSDPRGWIRGIDAPGVTAPGEENHPFIEDEGEFREVEGCGCRRLDGQLTGWRSGHYDDAPRQTAGTHMRYFDHKLRQFGEARSCMPNHSCADERIELGVVFTQITAELRAVATTVNWTSLSVRTESTCEAPALGEVRTLSNACSFRIREEGRCHSDCSDAFPQRVLEVAAALDQAGFESNDFDSPHWNTKYYNWSVGPLLANEIAGVFRYAGDDLQNGWGFGLQEDLPLGFDPYERDHWHPPGTPHEARAFCHFGSCWWQNPDRPISLERAAFLKACADVSMEDASRNVVDVDQDGVCDYWRKPAPGIQSEPLDNCPDHPNIGQADTDNDGVGDACDNCLDDYNPEQDDSFGFANGAPCELTTAGCTPDPTGDQCGDVDGDSVIDAQDNCPLVPNPESDCDADPLTVWQCDFDGDGDGDACDDSDGDGVLDADDNCRVLGNAAQTDTDGDNVGDACEPLFTFVSPMGDPTVAAQASAQNEFVFSADNPGVLTIPIQVDLEWDDYDSAIDEASVQHDAVGDSACSLAPVTWTPANATTWRIETELTCTGLPSRYDHFGFKTATVTLTRRGIEVGSVDQGFEVFWPLLASLVQPKVPSNFVRNHPGPIGPVEDPTTRPHQGIWPLANGGGANREVATRRPNWFYYWRQSPIGQPPHPYLDMIDEQYVEIVDPGGNQILKNLAVTLRINGVPNNLTYVRPTCMRASDPVRAFHTALMHESDHVVKELDWTRDGRGVLDEVGDLYHPGFWSLTKGRSSIPPFAPRNRWRDLDESHHYGSILCDLDGENGAGVGLVRESDIALRCTGAPVDNGPGLDVNFDIDRSWEVAETDPESFDHDADVVPDWVEQGYAPSLEHEDHINLRATQFRATITNAQVEQIDWSEKGANYDH